MIPRLPTKRRGAVTARRLPTPRLAQAVVAASIVVGALVFGACSAHVPRSVEGPDDRGSSLAMVEPPLHATTAPVVVAARAEDALSYDLTNLLLDMFASNAPHCAADSFKARIGAMLKAAALGDDQSRAREAEALCFLLLLLRADGGRDFVPSLLLPSREEVRRVRTFADTIARDLRRRMSADGRGEDATGESVLVQDFGGVRASAPTASSSGHEVVSWATLGGFEYTECMPLPEDICNLHGKRVPLVGRMFLLDEIDDVRHFLLVTHRRNTRLDEPPNLNEVVEVMILGLRGVAYSEDPIVVIGTFEAGEVVEEGQVGSLYRLRLDGPDGVRRIP